jgi:hypothetical protein
MDGSPSSPRALRDAVLASLPIALSDSIGSSWWLRRDPGLQRTLSTVVGVILVVVFGAAVNYNGYLASGRLACRDRVLAEKEAGPSRDAAHVQLL